MEQIDLEKKFLKTLGDHRGMIAKLCAMYAYDQESRKDLEQEVAMNIWKSFSDFRGESKISTWIYRVILNVCLKHTYSTQKKGMTFVELQENVAEEAREEDVKLDLRSCIQRLEFTDKSIILLYLEELPYSSISEIVGISENHVAVKVKRIKRKLAGCISKIRTS